MTSTVHGRLRLAGIVILVLGLLAAAAIYVSASQRAESAAAASGDSAYAGQPSPRELQQLERIAGKAAIVTLQFQIWLASLWQGTRLAYTVAVASLLAAFACFYIAGLMAEEPDARARHGADDSDGKRNGR